MSDNPVLTAITALHDVVAAIRDETVAFRVEVLGRFDRVENRLNAIRDDIEVNMARADHVERGSEAIREDVRSLREEFTIMLRKQRKMEAQLHDLTRPPSAP